MIQLLYLTAFASGAAALVFETLWFRCAGLVMGNTVWASTLVLSSFMAGLALGSTLVARYRDRLRRPLLAYGLLELVVGVAGLALVWLFPSLVHHLQWVFRPVLHHATVLHLLRFLTAFVLLVVPATAMGATLPLIVTGLSRAGTGFGVALGRLYGWNTLGAMSGAVLVETYGIGHLGMRGSAAAAAVCEAAVCLLALVLARRVSIDARSAPAAALDVPLDASVPREGAGAPWRALAAAFLCGAALLALEVLWFRFLLLFVSGTALAFAFMLATVLGAIAIGGLAGGEMLRRVAGSDRWLRAVALGAAFATVATYRTFAWAIPAGGAVATTRPAFVTRLALYLMLPTAFASGVLFTWLGARVKQRFANQVQAVAALALSNTLGGMIGPLVGGLLLLPRLGLERSMLSVAALYLVVAWLVASEPAPSGARGTRAVEALLATACVALAVTFPYGQLQLRYATIGLGTYARQGFHPIALREGLSETVAYLQKDFAGRPKAWKLVTNSQSMSDSDVQAKRYMKLYVYWPVAVHPDLRSALLISYGVGSTAKALTDTRSLETIDVVDISRDVLEMSQLAYPDGASLPLRDPRVHVHLEDGRFFLQSRTDRYDLITGEPPPPTNAGVVNLYTQEYFQLVHDHLTDHGICTYWLPLDVLGADDVKAVVGGFCAAFEDCSLWRGSGRDWMLAGTRGITAPVSAELFARQWRDPVVAPELRRLGLESPEQLATLFLADSAELALLTRGAPRLVDDFPQRLSGLTPFLWEVTPLYAPLAGLEAGSRRIATSTALRRWFPESILAAAPPLHRSAQAIDHHFGLPPAEGWLDEMATLRELVDTTTLEAPVLWLLGSDQTEQEIAAQLIASGEATAQLHVVLGKGAFARRDYRSAEAHLTRALALEPGHFGAGFLRTYALCMLGDREEAERQARRSIAASDAPDRPHRYWRLLEDRFGIDVSGA